MTEGVKFEAWLQVFAKNSKNPRVQNSEYVIQRLFEVYKNLPSTYGWLKTSEEAFAEQAKTVKSVEAFNVMYWQDMASNIEAYEVMVVWRGIELMLAALRSLNSHEILAPAVLSRSLLELGLASFANSDTIQRGVEDIVTKSRLRAGMYTCVQLETLLNLIIHGTRFGNPPEHLKQKNILSYLKSASKNPATADVLPLYDYLCDLAHPNLLGNARFWVAEVQKTKQDSRMVIMQQRAESMVAVETREKILEALCWSGSGIRLSFELGLKAVHSLVKRWPHIETRLGLFWR